MEHFSKCFCIGLGGIHPELMSSERIRHESIRFRVSLLNMTFSDWSHFGCHLLKIGAELDGEWIDTYNFEIEVADSSQSDEREESAPTPRERWREERNGVNSARWRRTYQGVVGRAFVVMNKQKRRR